MGYTAAVTERWNPHAKVRQDLFGFIDVLAFRPDRGWLLVQATSGSNHASRVAKILGLPLARRAAGTPCTLIEVWSWKKVAGRWEVRRQVIRFPTEEK